MKKLSTAIILICLFMWIYYLLYPEQKRPGNNQTKQNHYVVNNLIKTNDIIWGFDFISPTQIIFTEKSGQLKITDLTQKKITSLTGLPDISLIGQGGLLDVAYHQELKKIYFTYASKSEQGYTTSLARASLQDDRLVELEILFAATTFSKGGAHFGSRIVFQENYVFIGIGDRGHRTRVQDLSNHHGKIVRLYLDGSVPKTNPFYENQNALPEIWSTGHRNPQGLSLDHSGQLWEAEFGPKGGDEINLIKPGLNYGWPIITYGREYNGPTIGTTHQEGLEQPVKYYTPSISPSGINFYKHTLFKNWTNNLFVANLSSRHLRRLVIKDNQVVKEEVLLAELRERIRHVRSGPDGKLYFSTDSGLLAALTPATIS